MPLYFIASRSIRSKCIKSKCPLPIRDSTQINMPKLNHTSISIVRRMKTCYLLYHFWIINSNKRRKNPEAWYDLITCHAFEMESWNWFFGDKMNEFSCVRVGSLFKDCRPNASHPYYSIQQPTIKSMRILQCLKIAREILL